MDGSIADAISRVEVYVAGVLIAAAIIAAIKALLDVRTLKRESATKQEHALLEQRVSQADRERSEMKAHIEALGNVGALVHELREGFGELKGALSDLASDTNKQLRRQGEQIGFLVGLAKADTIVLRQGDSDKT